MKWLINKYHTLKNIGRNFILLWPVMKAYRSWNYHGLLVAMKTIISNMEKNQREYGYHLNRDKHCNRMKIAVEHLNRVIEDDYYLKKFDVNVVLGGSTPLKNSNAIPCEIVVTPLWDFPKSDKACLQKESKQREYHLKAIGDIFSYSKLLSWWD